MYADCEDYLSSTSTQDDYGTLNVKLKTEFCKYWTEGKMCPYGNKVIKYYQILSVTLHMVMINCNQKTFLKITELKNVRISKKFVVNMVRDVNFHIHRPNIKCLN